MAGPTWAGDPLDELSVRLTPGGFALGSGGNNVSPLNQVSGAQPSAPNPRAPAGAPDPTREGGGSGLIDDDIRFNMNLGRSLFGNDPAGALSKARTQEEAARDAKIAALRAARERLSGKAFDPTLALLGAAQGFLAPTRSGAFGENLGNALGGALPLLAKEKHEQTQREQLMDQLGIGEAEAQGADAKEAYNRLLQQMGLGAQFTSSAATALGRRQDKEDERIFRGEQNDLNRQNQKELRGMMAAATVGRGQPAADARLQASWQSEARRLATEALKDVQFPDARSKQNAYLDTYSRYYNALSNGLPSQEIQQGQAPMSAMPQAGEGTPGNVGAPTGGKVTRVEDLGPFALPMTDQKPAAGGDPSNPALVSKNDQAIQRSALVQRNKDQEKYAAEVRDAAETAGKTFAETDTAIALDAPTGKLAPIKTELANWFNALGISPDWSKAVQNANSITALRSILTDRNLTKQLEQKGVQTEGDYKRIMESGAQISNTKEANAFIYRYVRAMAARAKERHEFVSYVPQVKENNGLYVTPTGRTAQDMWIEYLNQTPMVMSNPQDGKPLFFNEYLSTVQQANKGMNKNDVRAKAVDDWRKMNSG